MTGRSRKLSRQELDLWRVVTRHVVPLSGQPCVEVLPEATRESAEILPEPQSGPAASPAQPPRPRTPPPLALLEPRARRKLARGQARPDAKIDLHGMRQDEAHSALQRFILRCHGDGAGVVLVVTGKGSQAGAERSHGERGVLRRNVPLWLASPELRRLVVGFEEASQRHGGSGALYVRLRSRTRAEVEGS